MGLCSCGRGPVKLGGICGTCFAEAFNEGFSEADEELRFRNPHVHRPQESFDFKNARTEWKETSYFNPNELLKDLRWEDVAYSWKEQYTNTWFVDPPFTQRPPRKPPWPRPQITWDINYDGAKVFDTVTEGWVMVPREAVENLIKKPISRPSQTFKLYRDEIEECARRLLILVLYGCPPKLPINKRSEV